MSYLRFLCLFAYSGVQHILCCVCLCIVMANILCCVIVLFFFVLCTQYCQVLWIVHFDYPSVFSNVSLRKTEIPVAGTVEGRL
jgi:hypothetical protein